MSEPRVVRFYLDRALRRRAEAGRQNFIARICQVLEAEGFRILFHNDSLSEMLKSQTRPGYSIFSMVEPTTARGLTFRRSSFYPFWALERTGKRWDWPVAKADFTAAEVPREEAQRFAESLRRKHFGAATDNISREGFVYMPLQGQLLAKRSFQSCSPIEMIEAVLAGETKRQILATLHPKEDYSAPEQAALADLAARHPRFSLVNRPMIDLLQRCDYLVTQTSSVAFIATLFRKPSVLFGRAEFHHIAANAAPLGPTEALAQAPDLRPDYDAYLWWFLQKMSINAGRDDAAQKIRQRLIRAGWLP